MRAETPTDYDTYREIMDELTCPISGQGLDPDTLKRLYESKLVYLENLRVKCFYEMNARGPSSHFCMGDYKLILTALRDTEGHLRELILLAVSCSLAVRKII